MNDRERTGLKIEVGRTYIQREITQHQKTLVTSPLSLDGNVRMRRRRVHDTY